MSRITTLILFVSLIYTLSAQTNLLVDLQKNSWIAINGTTNVISFKLLQSGEKILDKPLEVEVIKNNNKIYLTQNQHSIQVKNFESDNKMALRDFLKLIKSDVYPTLDVQLNHIETIPDVEKSAYSKGVVSVNIDITGVRKHYNIPVNSSRHGEYIVVDGVKKISIKDFKLEPPVEMLGLIRVSEWIVIRFHFVCKLSFEQQ